ncbi:rhamnonate dehydratase [Moraxella bovoculi]|uniref:LrgB-like protein n=1 Tax=Moraxella bovoculi 237 TaxID=743974 RepID=A0A066UBH6_9GAMM|nr:LrgB family protein [Moraxella bovoculi]AKG15558.2 rhamnonate dehydratase [Moraxella bovoculi]AKG17275.1 LrgB family protein [Moraxella bovoculi]AKG19029.1 rhamnonate dehydratase [Moraxella bovoculi]KDN24751.1 lrgB-like protein [Moraxella bovoculi 237]NSM10425.1 LrgB family protein [Moraxella bovoculi]
MDNITIDSTTILIAFVVTLIAHIGAKYVLRYINRYFRGIPMIIIAIVLTLLILTVIQLPYNTYYANARPVFDRLLGYSTVLLAVPLAGMDFKGLPVKKLSIIVVMASLVGAIVPMLLAYLFALNMDTILSFATRSVTTPVGLSVAQIIDAPLVMANLIIIVSGILGAGVCRILFKNITDDRAKGLALGLVAHAIGTVEAWTISPTAGRYAAFGLAINGLVTAVWLPMAILWLLK